MLRIRPALPGAAPRSGCCAFAIVIHHRRAGDCRARAGIGTCPVAGLGLPPDAGRAFVDALAAEMVRAFAVSPLLPGAGARARFVAGRVP